MRKLARYDAPVPVVRDMFRDTDAWPRWMEGIVATRTLSSEREVRVVEVVLLLFGRRLVQKLECRDSGHAMIHRQIEGWFKRWEAHWTFRPLPEGRGTTVSLHLDFELPLAGRLLPRKALYAWMESQLEETLERGHRRAVDLARSHHEPTQAVNLGSPILQIYETERGFEVHLAGRTFHVDALAPSDD